VLGVRPEHVALSDDGAYRGRVLAVEYLGTTQIVTIETANGNVKARVAASQPVAVGDQVGLGFNARTLTLFDEASGRALRSALNSGSLVDG
jgi:multiple sugar transport system ATP-binding protein